MGGRGAASVSSKDQKHISLLRKKKFIQAEYADSDGHFLHEKMFPNGDDDYSVVAEMLGVSEQDAKTLCNSIYHFTSSGGEHELYNAFRDGRIDSNELSQNLERYIELAPKWQGKTYRGEARDIAEVESWKVGEIVNFGKASSWSNYKNIAEDFAKEKVLKSAGKRRVIFTSNTQSKGTSVNYLSKWDEREILVSKKANFVISNIFNEGNVTYIELSER